MAPKWIRGTLVCAYQLAITCGLLLASIVSIGTETMEYSNAFRIPIALQFVWASILLLGLGLLPETPRYLIKRNLHSAAASSLSRLRRLDITHPALIEELAEIEANHLYELSLGPSTYKEIFVGSPHLGRRVLTASGLQMLQQLSGVNFILYYGTTFFQNIGVQSPFVIQLAINIVNMVSTVPGMILVEVLGRRRLLMIGATGMTISLLIVASVGTALPDVQVGRLVLIVFVCIYFFFFAASWGPVVWVVTSEIHPLKVRAKSMSISVASNWILNFAIAYGSPYLVGSGYINLAMKIFFVWGACCAVAVVFVYFMVYETSKISLEQIDEMYERVDYAWKSESFQPGWSFQELREEGASASGIQLDEPHDDTGRRAGTKASVTASSTESSTITEEDKIVAQLGDIDLSY
jgi:sugar porter (SP) family MFS transporter